MTEPFAGLSISLQLPLERLVQFKPEQLREIFAGIAGFVPLAGAQAAGKVQALTTTALTPSKPPAFRVGQPREGTWATPPVKEVLARMWPSSDPYYPKDEIEAAMTACGGPPIPKWSTIGVYAIQTLKLRRGTAPKVQKPPKVRKAKPRGFRESEPIVALETPKAAPGTELPPVSFTWDTIQREALRQGFELRSHSDLPTYNRQRVARGEAPFCIHRARAA